MDGNATAEGMNFISAKAISAPGTWLAIEILLVDDGCDGSAVLASLNAFSSRLVAFLSLTDVISTILCAFSMSFAVVVVFDVFSHDDGWLSIERTLPPGSEVEVTSTEGTAEVHGTSTDGVVKSLRRPW